MADSASDKAHLRMVTARTLHARYRMQGGKKTTTTKRARVERQVGSSFKEKFVCVYVCLCVRVCVRSGDMSGIESKIIVLFLIKPATEMWLFACSGRYLHCVGRLARQPAANQRSGKPAVAGAARCANLPKQSDV